MHSDWLWMTTVLCTTGTRAPLLATCRALEARVIGAQERLRVLIRHVQQRLALLEHGKILLEAVGILHTQLLWTPGPNQTIPQLNPMCFFLWS